MKSRRFLALLLALSLLLGAAPPRANALGFLERLFSDEPEETSYPVIPFSQMEYTRPDLAELQAMADKVVDQAQEKNTDQALEALYAFYDAIDLFSTNSALASIHYNADLTDEYWAEENDFCTSAANEADQMLYGMYTALAATPSRAKLEKRFFGEGFFDDFDTEEDWEPDQELLALTNRETELINQYYSQYARLNSLLGSFFPPYDAMAQTLVDLIQVRNQLAAHLGYDSYDAYANDYLYDRDYTPQQMAQYLDDIQQTLVPMCVGLSYDVPHRDCSEEEVFAYVSKLAAALGGKVQEAFQLMEEAGLYDITQSDNKFDSSFEVYLTSYHEPYIFMNPINSAMDQLTFAHEFGHFCNDYLLEYNSTSLDVAEIFSQAMELLSLIYVTDYPDMPRLKMVDSLCLFVEQSCYARFEEEMYRIPSEELSVDALCSLYARIAQDYGLDTYDGFDSRDFVTIPHFYTDPMYVFSYIISNDAAMQIYQMEAAQPGSGVKCYMDNLDNPEGYFLAFLESAGLESPFEEGHVDALAQTFQQILQENPPMATQEPSFLEWLFSDDEAA